MERDPVRFVWRAAPGLNTCLLALAFLAIPSVWVVLDLIRAAIDDAALGRAFRDGRTGLFLRFALGLPARIADGPLVLVPGFALSRPAVAQALLVALFGAALAAGLFLVCSGLIRAEIGRIALGRLEERILDAIASAPTNAADGARRAALLASDAVAGQRSFLGRAVGTPALGGCLLAACLIFLDFLDLWLLALCALGLTAFALAGSHRAALRDEAEAAELAANRVLRRSLADLADHLSAVAAHGTAALEQRRISSDMAPIRLQETVLRQRIIRVSGLVAALAFATVAGVLGLGAWLGLAGRLSPGQVAAGMAAALLALGALERLLRWRREREQANPVFAEIAKQLGSFNARRRVHSAEALPASGTLSAEGVVVDGTSRGGRLTGLDVRLQLPSHVALTGEPDSGARTFAGLLGGQLAARAGAVTFGGVSIASAEPADRALRLAFSGGDTLLLPNTLRANLLYGCPDPGAADIEDRITAALEIAGLRGYVYRCGLAGTIDPRREPELAAALVGGRAEIRAELDRSGLTNLVQPFDTARYNPHATIGENILFGVALGDTFREENLATQPFMRSLLDREDLARPLAELGAAVAKSTIEMFWGLPSESAIVGRFSILSGSEQEEFQAILARQAGAQRGATAARDTARVIGLALRYSESRHRLGLLGPDLQERLLRVRASFARDIPKSLEPSIEFFRPDRLCTATSVLDNLLFGRVAEDQAAARSQVLAAVRRVLEGLDLTPDILRVGLQTRIDPVASGPSPARSAAIDLARCLIRNPDNLVVERALDDLPAPDAEDLVRRLRSAMAGRGLLVVLPQQLTGAAELFDEIVAFQAGKASASTGEPIVQSSMPHLAEARAGADLTPEPAWSSR